MPFTKQETNMNLDPDDDSNNDSTENQQDSNAMDTTDETIPTFESKATSAFLSLVAEPETENNIVQIQSLISQGADINAQNDSGDTPLMLAVQAGNVKIVEFLCTQTNINFNATNKNGQTALDIAIEQYDDTTDERVLNILKQYIRVPQNFNIVSELFTNEISSIEHFNEVISRVKFLLGNGTQIDDETRESLGSNLDESDYEDEDDDANEDDDADADALKEKLIKKVLEIFKHHETQISSLKKAIETKNLKNVKTIIEKDPTLLNTLFSNDISNDLITPLMLASELGNIEIAEFLINKGANINHENFTGQNALMEAANSLQNQMLQYLITQPKIDPAAINQTLAMVVDNWVNNDEDEKDERYKEAIEILKQYTHMPDTSTMISCFFDVNIIDAKEVDKQIKKLEFLLNNVQGIQVEESFLDLFQIEDETQWNETLKEIKTELTKNLQQPNISNIIEKLKEFEPQNHENEEKHTRRYVTRLLETFFTYWDKVLTKKDVTENTQNSTENNDDSRTNSSAKRQRPNEDSDNKNKKSNTAHKTDEEDDDIVPHSSTPSPTY
mgnify:CR=1 FL=1